MAKGYCDKCGKFLKRKGVSGLCHECYISPENSKKHSEVTKAACQRPEVRQRKSRSAKKSWQDPDVWERHSQGMKAAHARGDHDNSEAMKEAWARGAFDDVFTPEVRERTAKAIREAHQRPEIREIKSKAAKKIWQRPEYRQVQIEATKAAWENGAYENRADPQNDQELRRMRSERMLGPNNPNWAGGTSKEPYGEEWTRQLKKYIRKRDSYQCVICGASENGRAHDCHHLDYDKTNSDPSNLVTLCVPCHRRTNHNRRFWTIILAPVAQRREEA